MEIINKRHEKITSNQRIDLAAYFKIESDKAVYFSAGAATEFGLSGGLYLHFVNDGDRWFFYCNSDKDGFKLISRPGKKATLICDASLVRLIKNRTKCSISTKFLITETNNKLEGQGLLEINFNKIID